MSKEHIGKRIREVRKVRQLSVRQLAGRVQISVSLLEKIEIGDRAPAAGLIVRLAQALKVGPDRLTGQPYANGPESDEQAQAVLPALRRIALTYDNPDDLTAPTRPLPVLEAEMRHVSQMRLDGNYAPMGNLLPDLLSELTHIALTTPDGPGRRESFALLGGGYRAMNSLAHKMGHHDLSMTAVERYRWTADQARNPLMQITAAYLRAGAMLRLGAYASARRVLEGLVDEIERLAPERSLSPQAAAMQGALLLKLSILESRDGRPERSRERLADARMVVPLSGPGEQSPYGMHFGPAQIRIYETAALVESGDTEQALARLREWGTEQGMDEWEPPAGMAAERSSHHHIDVASARLAQGDRFGAFRELETARKLAPTHTRYHPTVHSTAATLVRLDRSMDDSIAGLARWAGV